MKPKPANPPGLAALARCLCVALMLLTTARTASAQYVPLKTIEKNQFEAFIERLNLAQPPDAFELGALLHRFNYNIEQITSARKLILDRDMALQGPLRLSSWDRNTQSSPFIPWSPDLVVETLVQVNNLDSEFAERIQSWEPDEIGKAEIDQFISLMKHDRACDYAKRRSSSLKNSVNFAPVHPSVVLTTAGITLQELDAHQLLDVYLENVHSHAEAIAQYWERFLFPARFRTAEDRANDAVNTRATRGDDRAALVPIAPWVSRRLYRRQANFERLGRLTWDSMYLLADALPQRDAARLRFALRSHVLASLNSGQSGWSDLLKSCVDAQTGDAGADKASEVDAALTEWERSSLDAYTAYSLWQMQMVDRIDAILEWCDAPPSEDCEKTRERHRAAKRRLDRIIADGLAELEIAK